MQKKKHNLTNNKKNITTHILIPKNLPEKMKLTKLLLTMKPQINNHKTHIITKKFSHIKKQTLVHTKTLFFWNRYTKFFPETRKFLLIFFFQKFFNIFYVVQIVKKIYQRDRSSLLNAAPEN